MPNANETKHDIHPANLSRAIFSVDLFFLLHKMIVLKDYLRILLCIYFFIHNFEIREEALLNPAICKNLHP